MEVYVSGCVFSSLVYELENSIGDVVSAVMLIFEIILSCSLCFFNPILLGGAPIGPNYKPYHQHNHRFTIRKLDTRASCK